LHVTVVLECQDRDGERENERGRMIEIKDRLWLRCRGLFIRQTKNDYESITHPVR